MEVDEWCKGVHKLTSIYLLNRITNTKAKRVTFTKQVDLTYVLPSDLDLLIVVCGHIMREDHMHMHQPQAHLCAYLSLLLLVTSNYHHSIVVTTP